MTSTSSSTKVTGSCACRRITFESSKLGEPVSCCYCRECAKVSGTGYIPFIHFQASAIKWSQEPEIWRSSNFAERGFCKVCGSTITFRDEVDFDSIGIALSMIDQSSEPLTKPSRHIFLKEKADWVDVPNDDTNKFDGHETSFQKRLEEWQQSKH